MQYKKPIYTIRKDSCLATDSIKPYGDRVEVSSESMRREMALKLLDIESKNEKDDDKEHENNVDKKCE